MTTATDVIALTDIAQPMFAPAFRLEYHGRGATAGAKPGQGIPPSVLRDVVEVSYVDNVERVDSFTLQINNWDAAKPAREAMKFVGFGASEDLWKVIQPGNLLSLLMGYTGRATDLRRMTQAYVTSLEVEFPEAGYSKLTVRGLNVLDRLRTKQYTWAWPDDANSPITDSEIALDLARQPDGPPGRPGLGIEVRVDPAAAGKEAPRTYVMMHNQYPIVFLMQLARRNGYDILLLRDGPDLPTYLYFGPARAVKDRTYRLEWGRSITSGKATLSTAKQVKKVTVCGWDRVAKKPIIGEATIDKDGKDLHSSVRALAAANGREEIVTDEAHDTQRAVDERARNLLLEAAGRQVEFEGVTVGLPDLRAGRVVELSKLGVHLDGRYTITETTHTLNDSGYRTAFKARLEGPPR